MTSWKTENYQKGLYELRGRKRYGNKVCNYGSVDYNFLSTKQGKNANQINSIDELSSSSYLNQRENLDSYSPGQTSAFMSTNYKDKSKLDRPSQLRSSFIDKYLVKL